MSPVGLEMAFGMGDLDIMVMIRPIHRLCFDEILRYIPQTSLIWSFRPSCHQDSGSGPADIS